MGQAAGRVIRTPTDTGTVWLLDERYARPGVRACVRALQAGWLVDTGPANQPENTFIFIAECT
jgi:Rad3-related DNA helicase